MSGESIYQLLPSRLVTQASTKETVNSEQRQVEETENLCNMHSVKPSNPSYSTFFNSNSRQHDGTNVKFYKQREAVIGQDVGDTVDPQIFLRKGGGVHFSVNPIKEEKLYRKPPVNQGITKNDNNNSNNNNNADTLGDDGIDEVNNAGSRTQQYNKKFVRENIIDVSQSVPKQSQKHFEYATQRKDFGQVPKYLQRVKTEVSKERQIVEHLQVRKNKIHQQNYENYVYRLNEHEQEKLKNKLECALAQKTNELHRIPLASQSHSVQKQKAELEKAIVEIEKALNKLKRDALFVYKDDAINVQWTKPAAMQEAQRCAMQLSS